MAQQKINYTLIFLLGLIIISACRRESKQETVARWEIINPVTNAPYVGVPVRVKVREFREVNKASTTINLNGLKSGQYFIQITTESGKRYVNKIIIL